MEQWITSHLRKLIAAWLTKNFDLYTLWSNAYVKLLDVGV